jgi:4-aminobutyrate aminotransferase
MAKAWPGSQGGTYGGNAVAAAAAVATLDVVRDEGLVENSRVRGEQLHTGLVALAGEYDKIGDVRGLGLMQVIELTTAEGEPDTAGAVAVQQAAIGEDLLLLTCGAYGNVVRFIPALVVNAEEIDEGLRRIASALKVGLRG